MRASTASERLVSAWVSAADLRYDAASTVRTALVERGASAMDASEVGLVVCELFAILRLTDGEGRVDVRLECEGGVVIAGYGRDGRSARCHPDIQRPNIRRRRQLIERVMDVVSWPVDHPQGLRFWGRVRVRLQPSRSP